MIDIGANLANKTFANDLADVIQRARDTGIESIVVTGTDTVSSHDALQLCSLYPGFLYATAGLHPHDADTFSASTLQQLAVLQDNAAVVAVGETGLDFNRNFSTRENQLRAFEAHIQLAAQLQKPLFVHERDAFKTMRELLQAHQQVIGKAVIHCFTGDASALRCYLDMGLYIGITGWICDKKRGETLRQIVDFVPLNRLMIESDAPYLTPHKEKLKDQLQVKHRNEPWTLPYVSKAIADATNFGEDQVRQATAETARQFFGI